MKKMLVMSPTALLHILERVEAGEDVAMIMFEVLDECNENCRYQDVRVHEDRVVSQIAAIFRPTWYQVRPGWDLSVPMSVNYTIDGEKAPMSFAGDEEAGNASIGLSVDINQQWKIFRF